MRRSLAAIVILTMWGCAQQVAPTGGPKDEAPPEVLSQLPKNESTNFASNQIVIGFNEFIQLKNPIEQIIISPPLLTQPKYLLKQKTLIIKFDQELAENTTYTINFGEAIRDNNEGNVLKNFTYVFSTGAQLDSMQVQGKVTDAITGEPEENALVLLYKENVDSLPQTTMPNYFTRSGSDGSFHIHHVSNQPYKIFALKDENSNYMFDVPEEKIGFLDTLIAPFTPVSAVPDSLKTDSLKGKIGAGPTPTYHLKMFVEQDTTQFLKKANCEYYGKFVMVYNRPVSKISVELADFMSKKQWMLKDFSANRDSVTIWTTDVVPDTLMFYLTVDGGLSDTVELYMKPRTDEVEMAGQSKSKGKKKQVEKFALKAKSIPEKGRSPNPSAPFSIVWNHPITGNDLSKLKLYENSKRVSYDIISNDTALRKFDIIYPWKKDAKYKVLILDSAFTDSYNLWNDTTEYSFVGIDKNAFGELTLNITQNPESQVVIELLNSAKQVVQRRTTSTSGKVKFSGLAPGKYAIQVINDLNQNGVWDSGRYSQKVQPEPTKIIERDSEVRANWDLELEWIPNGK